MTNFAADAARDAETARGNARRAHEIARRYQNRSYHKAGGPSFVGSPPENGGGSSHGGTAAASFGPPSYSSSPTTTTTTTPPPPARPKPPTLRTYDGTSTEDRTDDETPSDTAAQAMDRASSTEGAEDGNKPQQHREQPGGGQASRQSGRTGDHPRRAMHTPSSVADRIAQHHAEDILQLTQELERTKQALKVKERAHEGCEAFLASLEARSRELEEQNRSLASDLEQERQRAAQQLTDLEQRLQQERQRVQEANEDAEVAVDIAKASSEERDQIEDELRTALEELRLWREGRMQIGDTDRNGGDANMMNGGGKLVVVTTPKRHVRFADEFHSAQQQHHQQRELDGGGEETPGSEWPGGTSRPSRSMVAAGRQVLRRNIAPSAEDTVLLLELTPSKSAELRERLRRRLADLEGDTSSPTRPVPGSPARAGNEAAMAAIGPVSKKKLDECSTATKILLTSGKKLDLDGYWWRDHHLHNVNSSKASSLPNLEIQLDAMTRQYCQNVEVRVPCK